MHVQQENNNTVADEVDPELLAKRKRKRYCLGRWTEPKKYGKISIRNEALKSGADGG